MKLSELVSEANRLYPNSDPEIRVAGSGGFLVIDEVLTRDNYYDESFFGDEFEKGKFIVIETQMEES